MHYVSLPDSPVEAHTLHPDIVLFSPTGILREQEVEAQREESRPHYFFLSHLKDQLRHPGPFREKGSFTSDVNGNRIWPRSWNRSWLFWNCFCRPHCIVAQSTEHPCLLFFTPYYFLRILRQRVTVNA